MRFHYNQHVMFTECILFSTLTTKHRVYTVCENGEGALKQFPDPHDFYRAPGFEILVSAPVLSKTSSQNLNNPTVSLIFLYLEMAWFMFNTHVHI